MQFRVSVKLSHQKFSTTRRSELINDLAIAGALGMISFSIGLLLAIAGVLPRVLVGIGLSMTTIALGTSEVSITPPAHPQPTPTPNPTPIPPAPHPTMPFGLVVKRNGSERSDRFTLLSLRGTDTNWCLHSFWNLLPSGWRINGLLSANNECLIERINT
jgi:hypothetical protein